MLLITISLLIASTFALRYGGNGGSQSEMRCSDGEYVESIEVRSGSRVDALRIKCTNQNWSEWKGGNGGNYHTFHASGSGFCGMGGRDGSIGFHKLCLTAVSGESKCFGTTSYSSGDYFHDRACVDSPGNSRARLTGFTVRSGSMIDGLTPHWETNIDCPYYLQIANSGVSSIDGYYAFDEFYKGHHKYKHKDSGACVYYATKAWRIHENCNTDSWNIKVDASYKYGICPSQLSGYSGWYRNGKGFVYPSLQVKAHDSLPLAPLEWGNGVGYWAYQFSNTGSSGGEKYSWSTSLTDTSSTSQTYSSTEESSFAETGSFTGTTGFELSTSQEVGFKFASASAEQKWSATVSLEKSTTETTTHATSSALETAYETSQTSSQTCESTAPRGSWFMYAWEVYRASSVENVGATQTTCEFQYQTGPCRFVPPNCPLGTCLDQHCIQCITGMEPYMSLSEIQAEYPGCLDSINLSPQTPACALSKKDWACCSADSPCGLHQGDCDKDSDCAGELVCSEDDFCKNNPDCPHSAFDVCVSPDRRELSQGDEDDEPQNDLDEFAENRAFRQKSRLLEAEKVADLKPKDLDEPLEEGLNSDDILSEEEREAEHQTVSGCIQFDDEGHCTVGPLYKYCRWVDDQCVNKENIKDEDVPEGDFSYVYDSSEPFFTHE